MKVSIDREGCIGCGLCAQVCEDVFRMAEEGKAEVYNTLGLHISSGSAVEEADEGCPVSVIAVEE